MALWRLQITKTEFELFHSSFAVDDETIPFQLQLELIELQYNVKGNV